MARCRRARHVRSLSTSTAACPIARTFTPPPAEGPSMKNRFLKFGLALSVATSISGCFPLERPDQVDPVQDFQLSPAADHGRPREMLHRLHFGGIYRVTAVDRAGVAELLAPVKPLELGFEDGGVSMQLTP